MILLPTHTHVEPGYYEDGSFGVRIENVVIIKSVETKVHLYHHGNISHGYKWFLPFFLPLLSFSPSLTLPPLFPGFLSPLSSLLAHSTILMVLAISQWNQSPS